MTESDDDDMGEVFVGEEHQDDESEDELAEVFEIQKKAKRDFKKNFKTYKDTKKKVKEIKKSRVGPSYYPVVAMPPDGASSASGSQQTNVKPFRNDRKEQPKKKGENRGYKPSSRKEDANFTETEVVTQFTYMVTDTLSAVEMDSKTMDVFLASIPLGYAIIDTGCTTSIIGQESATGLIKFFESQGFPKPQEITLPAVELKGFNGKTETTTRGLRWTVCLGKLQGCITTYVIPGMTPFLLSRKVLEAMEAVLDLKQRTITSVKHGLDQFPLRQASNGHLLLPLCEPPEDLEVAKCDHETKYEPNDSETASSECQDQPQPELPPKEVPKHAKHAHKHKITPLDKKRAFQGIVKNTKNGVVDVSEHAKALSVVFGVPEGQIIHAAVAYKPRKERMPTTASQEAYDSSVASLEICGTLSVSPWRIRPPSQDRRPVPSMSVAIFAFRVPDQPKEFANEMAEPRSDEPCRDEPACFCCNEHDDVTPPDKGIDIPVESLYEEISWVELEDQKPLPAESAKSLLKSIGSIRKASLRMTLSRLATQPDKVKAELKQWLGDQVHVLLSRLATQPDKVKAELKQWLGDQAHVLDKKVGLIEVFTGQAKLSQVFEKQTGLASIRLGLQFGQDFTRLHDRRCLLLLIAFCRPRHVWFSFPCKLWGPWTRLNLIKSHATNEKIMSERAIARRYLHNVSEAWNLQILLGGHAHAENPLASQAWAELCLENAWEVRIDQCALGLRSPKSDLPVFKPTRIVTSDATLASGLENCRCDGRHQHEHLAGKYKGKNLTSWAETYPLKFCKHITKYLCQALQPSESQNKHVEEILAESLDELEQMHDDANMEGVPEDQQASLDDKQLNLETQRAKALVHKVHVNTGHSSPEQLMRLANRCQSSDAIKQAIRDFKCSVCEEMKSPPLHRKTAIQHAESPNHIVGVDYVQVELHREDASGKVREITRNVLTAVDLATDFCQQIVASPGPHGLSKAFHQLWSRPYGVPKVIYMDPDHRNLSSDFQRYMVRNNIQLLHSAAESHWQLGRVEVANRILRDMAQRVWRACPDASPEEVIESCCTVRNEQLRKHGFSPAQWFLGRDSRHAGALSDVMEQQNPVSQSQIL